MDDDRLLPVSPRHSVRLARELMGLVGRPPQSDYVVSTIARREANGLPLMSAEIVIAGRDTREKYPLAAKYPLHFRKTYSPARMHGDPAAEFENQTLASEIIRVQPPIGYGHQEFRSCLVPGRPYSRLSPFGGEHAEGNVRVAQKLDLAAAAGLWRLAEEALAHLSALHRGGLAHGDAELHNFVVCPAPLELVLIDFEGAVKQSTLDDLAWGKRCEADLVPLLREAAYLECALGRQEGPLASLVWERLDSLFRDAAVFRRAIEQNADLG
jgi:hypothetical protein